MRLHLTARNLSLAVLALALVILSGAIVYKWYMNQKNFYTAGAPPKELLQRVEPKKVPYDSIKPPAVQGGETFLIGSVTSSYYGVIFFGDYTDGSSAKAFKDTELAVAAYHGKIRLIWRQLPASTDDGSVSFEAAVLSECSRIVNLTWSAHKALLDASSAGITKSKLDGITDNLDPSGMLALCREDATMRKTIRQTIARYRGDGIDTAPFVFVGTRAFPSTKATPQALTQAIRDLVK